MTTEPITTAVAVVGVGAILPDAPDAATFWANMRGGRYSITDVDPDRWDPAFYYDANPKAPDKTYSKIGGWVRDWEWNPLAWKLPIPPRVGDAIDDAQKWAVACTRSALLDYGWPQRPLDGDRTAVVLGNAMSGELHYLTMLRIAFPEIAHELDRAPTFQGLPADVRKAISAEFGELVGSRYPEITEDTMPGELGNCMAGRVANLFDLHGPNFVVDAACASALAAIDASAVGLVNHTYDTVIAGGIDRNMGASSYVKFCKIGALSATGTRPFDADADGFVMGEGAGVFVLKRLADAERDGDRIYAVLRGMAGASDGRGKAITAPNSVGQRLAVERAWRKAGLSPASCGMVECHGTSTPVGDVVEVTSISEAFAGADLRPGSVAIGSAKSNIGHLKAAAGAAGFLKTVLALHHKELPPSLHVEHLNPKIDWAASPLSVNTELRPWDPPSDGVRTAGVSAFGFGGTNFHAVLEEYVPGRLRTNGHKVVAVGADLSTHEVAPVSADLSTHEVAPVSADLSTHEIVAVGADLSAADAVPVAVAPTAQAAVPVAAEPTAQAAVPVAAEPTAQAADPVAVIAEPAPKPPLRGALVLGADDEASLVARLRAVHADAVAGHAPDPAAPRDADLRAAERIAIDYADAGELADKADQALAAFEQPARWKVLRGRGIYRGRGPAAKVAFLYTGQGSQYANMLAGLRGIEPVVAQTFDEADAVMTPLLGRTLTSYVFVDADDADAVAAAEADLRKTEITQPAVLTVDLALTRLLGAYGMVPDLVMGHSLGEYGALVAAGALSFPAALEAVSARGREMADLSMEDNGAMAAVFAPLVEIEKVVADTDGYVVVANVNSPSQAVIGGATVAVTAAVEQCVQRGFQTAMLPVSHAFHTSIVAPASEPLRRTLERLELRSPEIPIVSNVTGCLYPMGPGVVPEMLDLLAAQVASPVQFVQGLRTLYDAGARVFVEVGPKWALRGFAAEVLGDDALALATNHPKLGDTVAFNQALCGLYAAGVGLGEVDAATAPVATGAAVAPAPSTATIAAALSPSATVAVVAPPEVPVAVPPEVRVVVPTVTPAAVPAAPTVAPPAVPTVASGAGLADATYLELGRMFAGYLDQSRALFAKGEPAPASEPVVITGAALGLPGAPQVFDDANVARILHGEQGIGLIPPSIRDQILDKHITRLVKGESGARFETIDSPDDVIKLAGRAGEFDLGDEFGVDKERIPALGRETQLAIAAGIDALRDAGIPLVLHYRTTSVGSQLPDRWRLPDELRDTTGVIFASAFPGLNDFADEVTRFGIDSGRREELAALEAVRAKVAETDGHGTALAEIDRRIHDLELALKENGYSFDRRFLFRCLSMGHAQFAELIGARGPNTQINAACASTTQAITMAEDWIRAGRCQRVVVIAADDVTSDRLLGWVGSGFLASGAAATDEVVEDAAVPFDRRRHGMILGMGAAAILVESAGAARQRGIRPICEVVGAVTANSAFHGTRLDVDHIGGVMESVVAQAEARGARREEMAPATVFISHETYTPARGGSAAAEVNALRRVFGAAADQVVVANTKGYTGHPMGVGIEDVVAVKALETGIVPAVPNFKEPDPDLGALNLSKGGKYPVRYALRLAAGFGSQISMTLLRWVPTPDGQRPNPDALGYAGRIADPAVWQEWLSSVTGEADPQLEVDLRTLRVAARDTARTRPPPKLGTKSEPKAEPKPEPTADEPAAIAAPATTPEVHAAAPAAPIAVPAETPVESSDADLAARVVALVAEQTGYPTELLAVDLDMEADLGIDTVKQAELFAQIRETYGIERDDNLKLRDYPTLDHVIGFVRDRIPHAPTPQVHAETPATTPEVHAAAPAAPIAVPAGTPVESSDADLAAQVVALVAEQTGYPTELLAVDLDMEADLGIDTVKQAELFAQIRETYGIERDDNLKLRDYPTLDHVIGFVRDRIPHAPTPQVHAETPATTPEVHAAAPAAPIAVPAETPVESSDADLAAQVVALVAEQTGYPTELLAVDLDMEADLGIDTVKQAELFAQIRETYGIERDDNLKLRDYPTLDHVIGFVRDRIPHAPTPQVHAETPATTPEVHAAAPAAPIAVPAETPVESSDADLAAQVVALVAEQTGYPTELLAVDLDMEADLGIDTVKQAELFAQIRETYGIERDDNLKLRDYPTLDHVIGFVRDRIPHAPTPQVHAETPATTPEVHAAAPAAPIAVPAETPVESSDADLAARVVALVAEQTGYPTELLAVDLDMEADLGIDTVKQAELFAQIRETYGIERDDNLKLRDYPTLDHVIGFVRDRIPHAPTPQVHAETPATTPEVHAAAPAAPIAVPAGTPVESSDADLAAQVVALVAEQTGYPTELLAVDLDMEADLGIDTVKQAELFAQIRETYGIERDDNLKLRDYPTLDHVIGFVRDRIPHAPTPQVHAETPAAPTPEVHAAAPAAPIAVPAGTPVESSDADLAAQVVALVAEQTGYPTELLAVDLDMEADLGIDTVKQAELFAQIRETYGIERDDNLKLRDYPTLDHVIGFVRDRIPHAPTPQVHAETPAAPTPEVHAAAPAAPIAVPAGTPVESSDADLAAQVVALVAEQTGYPTELLAVDLDMEADLGIDTVKQAELFAQIRETYGIERDDNLKLRDYPTLDHVIGFVRDRIPHAPTPQVHAAAPATEPAPVDDAVAGFPRRVPVPVVRPPLDWFAPTGVRLMAGSRVVILPDSGGVAEALSAVLSDRGVTVLTAERATDTQALVAQITAWLDEGPIEGLYALAGLDNEGLITDLDIDQWHDGLRVRVKRLAGAARVIYDGLADGAFVVAATRNGGAHGYDDAGACSAMGGAVSGFTKALARERPAALVKVVDVEVHAGPAGVAGTLVGETLRDAGVVEIGRRGAVRLAIGLEERTAAAADGTRALGPDSVVVATGAAGSIVSAIVADLARAAGGGTFYLLDLIPEPDPADPDLAKSLTDRDGLKRELGARIVERGERATPALIERELAAIERRRAARATIDAITDAGGTARWYAADLRDGEAVSSAATEIRAHSERIDVLLHAGGLEISHFLPDKPTAEFDLVFDVKADGWFHLLRGFGDMPIAAAVVFSSIAGRFGNGGQTDYSAANDLLCKSVSSFRSTRPETRGIAIDWTAWADIGMASRGSIPKMMALASIDMLPPTVGIPVVRREVTAGGAGAEVVVAGALGAMVEEHVELDPTAADAAITGAGPMVGHVGAVSNDGVVVVTRLDPAAQPFLHHHRIDGTPVLPGVMGMEAFAETASLLAPGWQVEAIEDVAFLAPFKWYRDEPRQFEVHASVHPDGDRLVADCRLDGRRTLPGQPERVTTHFTGRVVLSPTTSDLGTVTPPGPPAGAVVAPDAIYRVYFHGPAYQVLGGAWRDGDTTVGELAAGLPANHAPGGGPLVAAPRLVELCFQTAGAAELAAAGSLGLPRRVRRLQVSPEATEVAARWAVVTAGEAGGVDAVVLDGDGRVLVRLTGYETVALPGAAGADLLEPLEAALR